MFSKSCRYKICLFGVVLFAGIRLAVCSDSLPQVLERHNISAGVVAWIGQPELEQLHQLADRGQLRVQVLLREFPAVQQLRKQLEDRNLCGRVSVLLWSGDRLPYPNNFLNALVLNDQENKSTVDVGRQELLRVLVPHGVALIREGDGWQQIEKPWPQQLDEWTHWFHDVDSNPVAKDLEVGPPRRLQWTAEPLWQRHHDTVPSTTAIVSAGGRLFYICDEAPACIDGRLPDRWFLVARDAFNGTLLWKKPIKDWGWHCWSAQWRARFNIPPELPKRLVATGDRVFVTLGFHAPVSVLDAATGRLLQTLKGTEGTDEILHREDYLVLAVNNEYCKPSASEKLPPITKTVMRVDLPSGKIVWKQGPFVGLHAKFDSSEPFGRLELTLGKKRVFLADQDKLVALDLASGRRLWQVDRPPVQEHLIGYGIRMSDQSRMLYQDGVVLFAQPEMKRKRSWHTLPGTLYAFSAEDGTLLWKHPYGAWPHNWQPDVFVVNGVVWTHEHIDVDFPGHEPTNKDKIDYAVIGLDLHTGKLLKRYSTKEIFNVGHHHRCYRQTATERFLLCSRRGIELVDLANGHNDVNYWARAGCLLGFIPCNGLIYITPHPCDCYIEVKLNGYNALASGDLQQLARLATSGHPLIRARGERATELTTGTAGVLLGEEGAAEDWATFRHDVTRSGYCPVSLHGKLSVAWQTRFAAEPGPPTVAAGKVFVPIPRENRLLALDAKTGSLLWTFVAGGTIDTPPTYWAGKVYFGSADGWLYCLEAENGRLLWTLRVAPEERYIGTDQGLQSAWPLPGSVLLQDGVLYAAAGRSSYLDGGIFAVAVDPQSGKLLDKRVVYSFDPKTGKQPSGDARSLPGLLADVLVGDTHCVFMRQMQLFGPTNADVSHLMANCGLRDPTWFNRTCWSFGPVGHAQMLVFDDEAVYAVEAYRSRSRSAFFLPGTEGYRLFAVARRTATSAKQRKPKSPPTLWQQRVPVRVTGMAVTKDELLLAGLPDVIETDDPLAAFEGRAGSKLLRLEKTTGNRLEVLSLPSAPVYDGLAVAQGAVFICCQDGAVRCLRPVLAE